MSDGQKPDPRRHRAGGAECRPERREAIAAFIEIGLVVGLQGCAGRRNPDRAAVPETTPANPEVGAKPRPVVPVSEHVHPAQGDRLVFAFGDREGEIIAPHDVPAGGPQIFAYSADADGSHVATESRLGQVMLVRVDPSQLSDDTAAVAADGIVAYSAICTHTGCEISDWKKDTTRFKCPCHESEFDPLDNGRVVQGPARRRLAALPLTIVDDELIVAGGFTGRLGAEQR